MKNGKIYQLLRMAVIGLLVGLSTLGSVAFVSSCKTSRTTATVRHRAATATDTDYHGSAAVAIRSGDCAMRSERGDTIIYSETTSLKGRSDATASLSIRRDSAGRIDLIEYASSRSYDRAKGSARTRASATAQESTGRLADTLTLEAQTLEEASSAQDEIDEERQAATEPADGSGWLGRAVGWGIIGLFLLFIYRILSPYIERLWKR